MDEALTVGDILFEQPDAGPHQVVRLLASFSDAVGWLGELPADRRMVTELELAARLATILRTDLGDLLTGSWTRFPAVRAAAVTSRLHTCDPVLVPLATHRLRRSLEPVIEIYAGSARLTHLVVELHVELTVSGLILKLLDGRIVGTAAGSWSGAASLACDDHELVRRSVETRSLSAVLSLGDGVDVGDAAPARALHLVVEPALGTGRSTIDLDASIVIGRHPSCGIVLPDDQEVAPLHAGVYHRGDVVVLEDLQSPSGTYFNGRRMTAPAILKPGDEVQVGRHHFQVA